MPDSLARLDPLIVLYYIGYGDELAHQLGLLSWEILVFILFGIVNTVCVFGVWQWKKWGVYGFIVSGVNVFVISLATLGLAAAFGLIGVGLMVLLVQDKWAYFD